MTVCTRDQPCPYALQVARLSKEPVWVLLLKPPSSYSSSPAPARRPQRARAAHTTPRSRHDGDHASPHALRGPRLPVLPRARRLLRRRRA